MTHDPMVAYRAELRRAAVKRTRRYRQRRRVTVSLAIALGAFLVAGGAIAAQRTWFDDAGTNQIRIRYSEDHVAGLSEALEACLASHGARPVAVNAGGALFRNASAAMSQCGAFATSMRLTCGTSASQRTDDCVVTAEWMPGLTEDRGP